MRKRDISWREDGEDGERLEIRAERGKIEYTLSFKAKGDEEWTAIRKPSRERLEALLELMDARYRRRKGSLKEVEVVQRMIQKLG